LQFLSTKYATAITPWAFFHKQGQAVYFQTAAGYFFQRLFFVCVKTDLAERKNLCIFFKQELEVAG
jgi:hypothetical protein